MHRASEEHRAIPSALREGLMPGELTCPKCDFVFQPKSGDTTLSHCPACGTQIACPHCGTTLDHQGQPTTCSHCHAEIEFTPTRPCMASDPANTELNIPLPGFEVRGELGRGGMGIVYR